MRCSREGDAGGGNAKSVNRDFGALGNGTANDTAALTAAVAAVKAAGPGHTLLLPAGVYRVSATFQFNNMSDFTVRGEGATIKPFGSMTVADYNGDVIRFTNCRRFVVEGLTLNGNRASRNEGQAVTFRVFGSSDFTVRNCTMLDATWDHVYVAAVFEDGQVSSRAHACRFENCTLDGEIDVFQRDDLDLAALEFLRETVRLHNHVRHAFVL